MPFKFSKIEFNGDPNIGLYGFATNDYCVLGIDPRKKILEQIKKTLKADIKVSTITGTQLIGLFASGNSNGIVLTKIIENYELNKLKKLFGINLEVIKPRETALGNLILCNDNGCIISKSLFKYKKAISDALGCEVVVGKVANVDIVGSVAIASNVGCLCHREATKQEMEKIEKLLKVKVDVGTVGYGSPFIKSGLIVNSKGALYSEGTTGAELGRISEVFGE
ncbi:MAG: translation initiation factor IF-6 [Candidatus Aenigmatarchaeota archaeon]